tara:strand:- start:198 stop:419 length:222 start_codon:yes stop_codon:yes gene_type:complete
MINNTLPISEGFILAIIGTLTACVAAFLKFILKSRCRNIACCCGLISCIREPIELTAIEVETRSTSHIPRLTN